MTVRTGMNRRRLLKSLLPALAVPLLGRPAVAAEPPATDQKYRLFRSLVGGAEPRQWVFVFVTPGTGGEPFVVSPAKLLWAVENVVPAGATLAWSPGCLRIGGEPLNSAEELAALTEACGKREVKLVIVPAG